MWEKILRIVGGKDTELRERMFRTIILFGALAVLIGVMESFFVMKMDIVLLASFFLMLLFMIGTLYLTFKVKKYHLAALLLFVMIVGVMLPVLFFLSGGIYGAAPVWFSLGIVYVFIMFQGKELVICLFLALAVNAVTYWVAYRIPEAVIPMVSEAAVYLDSYFAITAVALIVGLLIKSHMKVYDIEHKQNVLQRKELEASKDSQNAFFANMSHEIRTPINAIVGLNEMILRESDSTEIKNYARDIKVASEMLLGQVNDILDLSQMEIQKMPIIPAQYKTVELFEEVIELMRVRIEKKGLQFIIDIDAAIPSVLYGDAKRLKQILINLLDNAYKYTESGIVKLSAIGEKGENDDFFLKVSVADSGIGIRKEDMEYIYDSFHRFDAGKNGRILGSGLGLAITKQLLDLMNGEIALDSVYTKGSIFTVTVPQRVEDETQIGAIDYFNERMSETEEIYRPVFEAPKARILIVDDNSLNVKVASSLLSATKVKIDVAANGQECLEKTKEHQYHVILLDYMMPGMNGAEILKQIRKQENGLCRKSGIIALTANAVSNAHEAYQAQGFDSYVEKPIDGKTLETEILRLLPKDVIEYEEDEKSLSVVSTKVPLIRRTSVKKRKKVYVTTDCTCDLPEEYMKKYDILPAYIYIETPNGRFVDTKEIDSDSLKLYLKDDKSTAVAQSLTVEEYEQFFAEALSQAEKVIHISLASYMGDSYEKALSAAKSFDHVQVIDSGQSSSGQGLLALYAAKLAMDGTDAAEICENVERAKTHIRTRAVAPGATLFYQKKLMRIFGERMCHFFKLHPMVRLHPKRMVPEMLFGGTMESAWRSMICIHLRKRKKISRKVVYITHVNCNVKQQEMIVREVLKRVPFEKVIVEKASFTTACSTGLGAIGISYYLSGKKKEDYFG